MTHEQIKVMLRSAAYTAYRRLTEEKEPDLYAIASILESVAVDAKLEIPVATIKQTEIKAVPADMDVETQVKANRISINAICPFCSAQSYTLGMDGDVFLMRCADCRKHWRRQ